MKTISVRQFGDGRAIQTRDARIYAPHPVRSPTRDFGRTASAAQMAAANKAMWEGKPTRDTWITTSTRITAERAPPAPDRGTLHSGEESFRGKRTREEGRGDDADDTDNEVGGDDKGDDKVTAGFKRFTNNLEENLLPAEVRKVKAQMLKYAGANVGRANAVGIASSVSDARRSLDEIQRRSEESQAAKQKTEEFWDRQHAQSMRQIFGR